MVRTTIQTTAAEVLFSMNCSGISTDVRAYIVKKMHYDLLIGSNVMGHNHISVSTKPFGEHHITAGKLAREIPCMHFKSFYPLQGKSAEELVILLASP